MPYRSKVQEPLDDGVRRIAREQLGRALAGFAPDKPRDKGIHDCRRRLKKLRALLRLVRPAIGEKAFHKHNSALRDAALLLSGARDLFVLEETLTSLEAGAPARTKPAVVALRAAINAAKNLAGAETEKGAIDEGVLRIRESLQTLGELKCEFS